MMPLMLILSLPLSACHRHDMLLLRAATPLMLRAVFIRCFSLPLFTYIALHIRASVDVLRHAPRRRLRLQRRR